jgi:anti-anti-sigma factor
MPEETMPETVVVVTGAFEGAAADRWGRLIADAVGLRPQRLTVDMRDSPTVDAAAIAILLQAHRAMVHTGGRLVLRGPVDRVRRMLQVARVDEVFEVETAETKNVDTS